MKKICVSHPRTIVIITPGIIDRTLALEALRLDADEYMVKPFTITNLLDRISSFTDKIPSA